MLLPYVCHFYIEFICDIDVRAISSFLPLVTFTVRLSSSHSNTPFSACNLTTTHRSQQHQEDSYGNEIVPNSRWTEECDLNTRPRIMWGELRYKPDCLRFNPWFRSVVPPRPNHSIRTERARHTYETRGCSSFRTSLVQLWAGKS